jgi:hypothetical protein
MPTSRSYFIDKGRNVKSPFFSYGGRSGLLTGVAAGTSSAGHLYALRNPADSGKTIHLALIRLLFTPTTAFGAAQALRLALFKLTAYTVAHTGGTAITPAKRRTGQATASIATARIGDTGALTAGTHTLAAQPRLDVGAHSTLPVIEKLWTPGDGLPEIIEPGEGLLIRNETLMGASGVGYLSVEADGWER